MTLSQLLLFLLEMAVPVIAYAVSANVRAIHALQIKVAQLEAYLQSQRSD